MKFLFCIGWYTLLVCGPRLHAQDLYDRALADSLGADEHGMRPYVLVILSTGPAPAADKERTATLFRGHMENIGRLAASGKLVVAGPIQKNEKNYRGIFILNLRRKEDAAELLAADPAIREGLLSADLFLWYGSAALPLYLDEHRRIEKKKP